MKVLAATLISLSLFAWAASHARIGAAQVDSSSTASVQDSRSINIEERFATANQRTRRTLYWLDTG